MINEPIPTLFIAIAMSPFNISIIFEIIIEPVIESFQEIVIGIVMFYIGWFLQRSYNSFILIQQTIPNNKNTN